MQPDPDVHETGSESHPGDSRLSNPPQNGSHTGPDEGASGNDPVANPHPATASPQYGERTTPEYGALKSQYPDWNPYVYGQPEPEQKDPEPQQNSTSANPFSGLYRAPGAQNPSGGHAGQQQGNAQQGNGQQSGNNHPAFNPASLNPAGGQSRMSGGKGQPRFLGGVNLDDPNQNPVYGRWDPYAVISFITVFFMALPIFPLIIGIIAIYRTTVFHMKGRGLAIAAVVIAIIELVTLAVMMYFGISTDEMLTMLQSWADSNSGSGASFSA